MRKEAAKDVYVLLVEDDRDDFFLTQDLLQRIERERYWVVWAGSYERAKLELHERAFDVALVDYRIGERTGLDFIAEVGPRYPHCPMILLTGLADPDIDFAAERAGAADYLVKDSLTEALLDRSIRYARQSAQRRALLDGVLASAATGMVGLDAGGTPIIWNRKAIEALELDQSATGPVNAGDVASALSHVRAAGDSETGEFRRADGRSFEISLSRMKDGGAVAVLHDITMRVQAEAHLRRAVDEAERANKAKSSFLATMSHELRTPLNGILGMTRVLESTASNEVQRDSIDVIRSSGVTLLNIINDILDLSKIEAGRMELEHIELSVPELVDDVIRMLAPNAREKGVELAGFVDPSVTTTLRGDPLRIRQVLTNLVGNAVKFTTVGSILVTVEAASLGAKPGLRFSVIDTGIGIPPEKLDRLFQKFSQVDASTTREFGGTGLGLALCKELIGLMGGSISCSSLPDHGSTFSFILPAEEEEQSIVLSRQAAMRCQGSKLLVASPSAGIINVASTYARAISAGVASAATLDAARRHLEAGKFDAVIVDGTFGSAATGEFLEHTRARHAGTSRIFLLEGLPGQAAELRLPDHETLRRPFKRRTFDQILKRLKDRIPATPARPETAVAAAEGRRLRILMAEDNIANQRVATALLKAAGFRIEIVSNGRLAVERGASGEFDIILMDVQMPVMDGLTATRHLREMDLLKHTPIVGLTAGAMEEDRNKCISAGMSDYLSKPIDWDQLLSLLDRIEKQLYASATSGTASIAAA
ncbi:MAG: response regulator [Proteobacteria bacterium]|nr:response regulator [Pseudomonadota bacterium]